MEMLKPSDGYFEKQAEPFRSCLLSLRALILSHDALITESWKYGMPFFCYQGKMCCYLWVHKKQQKPYLGIVEGRRMQHKDLVAEKRSKMKVLLVDPLDDLPVEKIKSILNEMLLLYH